MYESSIQLGANLDLLLARLLALEVRTNTGPALFSEVGVGHPQATVSTMHQIARVAQNTLSTRRASKGR